MKQNTDAVLPQEENPTLTPEVVAQTPDLSLMKRGDTLAIWTGYKSDFEALKGSIETVLASDPALPANAKIARANRLEIRRVRLAVESKRKELGEVHLREIQGINREAKILKDMIEPYEEKLQAIEDHAERVEAERITKLTADRVAELSKFTTISNAVNYGALTDAEFDAMLADAKKLHELREAEAKRAEEIRIAKEKAEAEERERIRLENERLKKEAEEREAAIAIERRKEADARAAEAARVEAERKAAEEKSRKEREAIEAKAKADREAAEAKAEADRKEAARLAKIEADRLKAIADKERKEREAAEAQIAAQKAKEEKERRAMEAAAKKAAAAPDAEKLRCLAKTVRSLAMPQMTTEDGQTIVAAILSERETFAKRIETAAAEL
jgi:hypothetical protein